MIIDNMSKRYPRVFCDKVVESTDIVGVIGDFVKLTKKGSEYMGVCPFHADRNPSFSVSQNKQTYHCFGCQASGNVITFLKNFNKMEYSEAIEYLAQRNGMPLPDKETADGGQGINYSTLYKINNDAAKFFYKELVSPGGRLALNYIKERKLLPETVVHYGLGFSPAGYDTLYRHLKSLGYTDDYIRISGLAAFDDVKNCYHDKFWNRVMFPIFDIQNHVIAFGGRVMGDGKPKYLNSPETPVFQKRKNMYGLNIALRSKKDYFISCEGYMDVISLHQAGFTNAVASLGTALTNEQLHEIKRRVNRIYLSYDSDSAGVAATLKAIEKCRDEGFYTYVIDMKPYKDPDEFIKNLGMEEYQKRIDNAITAFKFSENEFRKGFDLNNPSEKLAYINGLAERLSRIRDPIERDTYLQAVARENGVDEKQLKKRTNELGISQDKNQEKEAVKEAFNEEKRAIRINSDGLYNAQKIILSLLCENNSLYKKICDYISPADFYEGPPRKLASHIFEMLGKQEKCSNATLINYFCDDVDSDSYAELLSFEIYGDHDENSEKLQLAQTVIKIMENRFRARISADADTSGQDISVTAEYINFMNNRAEIEKKIRN